MTQYLLTLHYPAYRLPIRLFKRPENALQFASEFGLVDADDMMDFKGPIGQAFEADPSMFKDLGREENRKPNGYSVTKFEDGIPVSHARIEPFDDRSPVFGDKPEEPTINPTQTLAWSD